jgi:hypothetical protein
MVRFISAILSGKIILDAFITSDSSEVWLAGMFPIL